MIKAIILDLGGVYFSDGTKIASQTLSKKFNLEIELISNTIGAKSKLGNSYRKGEITLDEFWNDVKKELNIQGNNNKLNHIFLESYSPNERLILKIKELKQKGIKIYYLSDNTKERSEYLQKKFNYQENFIDGVYSFKVKHTKKEGSEIFKIAINKIGEKPENLIYVDDKEDYLIPAKKLGMNVICFKNNEQFEKKLKKFSL